MATFLQQVSSGTIRTQVPASDLDHLQQLDLIQVLTAEQLAQLQQEVGQLQDAQLALAVDTSKRDAAADLVGEDTRKSHSILFRLEGVDHENATLERLGQEQAALKNIDDNLAKRQQDFAQLLVKKALLSSVTSYGGGYVGVTTPGRMALRDLNVALYRVGDEEFSAYWEQARKIDTELWSITNQAALLQAPLAQSLADVDPSYLWAVSIGVAKAGGDPQERLEDFLATYRGITPLSDNLENRLMSAEILSVLPSPLSDRLDALSPLLDKMREFDVPSDAALGVASILLLGRRADGTYATDPLQHFLTVSPSYEAAALLAIVNVPYEELVAKFGALKSLFASWGYSGSEDTELSSAYLATSDLPVDTVSPKLAIISHGMAGYLQYPLVASSILASIPTLEANETLNLLEKAYEILGQRTGPMSQAELMCLAVRLIHGIDVKSVNELDATAGRAPIQPGFSYVGIPPILWMPVLITHGVYYSTFSGIGGAHPAHVHAWGGGGWGGFGG